MGGSRASAPMSRMGKLVGLVVVTVLPSDARTGPECEARARPGAQYASSKQFMDDRAKALVSRGAVVERGEGARDRSGRGVGRASRDRVRRRAIADADGVERERPSRPLEISAFLDH